MDANKCVESIRHSLVYCMRSGDRLVLWIGKLTPDFKNEYNFPGHWPSNEIFDFKHWREKENYMKIVHEDENHDLVQNHGKFVMNEEKFQMIILADYTEDADV